MSARATTSAVLTLLAALAVSCGSGTDKPRADASDLQSEEETTVLDAATPDSAGPDSVSETLSDFASPDSTPDGPAPDSSHDGIGLDSVADGIGLDGVADGIGLDGVADGGGPDGVADGGGPDGVADGGGPDGVADGGGPDGVADSIGPDATSLVFNEVLIDADTDTMLDPNGDGDLDPVDDEFVEILNVSAEPVDVSGFTLVEQDLPASPRHTFAPGTVLPPGEAIVVFGGGEAPDAVPGAQFVTADNKDAGISFGLHLTDSGNVLHLRDASSQDVAVLEYGSQGGPAVPEDQSLTRFPDGTGDWVPHASVAPAGELFSPGATVSGAAFGN